MITVVTKGIKVSVETNYQPEYSQPAHERFVFTYRITIENNSNHTVQLKARHWDIYDIAYPKYEVEGEGVVGKQPILELGEIHRYVSGCNLRFGVGKMSGYYIMAHIPDGRLFNVDIPEFIMIVPFKLN
ncbi:MAG: Co2+/Mg2+ efflux protein ApaG [Ekhidna sp.]|nr:Co2+/Mg2+ efflux protein ApaG [Ekhidna sp.]MBC6410022.1 Co2+/Mg2+ efflux protein ApaG [Ekhidna sp.]MBC6427191.1 Co2+/Mg2+ efflux protein ApaG [Ekhidna sp.]